MMMVISLKRFRKRAVPVIEWTLTLGVGAYMGLRIYQYFLG